MKITNLQLVKLLASGAYDRFMAAGKSDLAKWKNRKLDAEVKAEGAAMEKARQGIIEKHGGTVDPSRKFYVFPDGAQAKADEEITALMAQEITLAGVPVVVTEIISSAGKDASGNPLALTESDLMELETAGFVVDAPVVPESAPAK